MVSRRQAEVSVGSDDASTLSDPVPGGVTVVVRANINSIAHIDPQAESFTVVIAVKLLWIDPRLAGGAVASTDLDSIAWRPNWVLSNAVEDPSTIDDAVEYDDFAEGRMARFTRIRATVVCDVDLIEFPFDTQQLRVTLRFPRHHVQGINAVEVASQDGGVKLQRQFLRDKEFDLVSLEALVRYAGDKGHDSALHDVGSAAQPGVAPGAGAGSSAAVARIRAKVLQPVEPPRNRKPEFNVVVTVRRRPVFWLSAIVLPVFMCVLTAFDAFVMDVTEHGDRMALVVTLLLTVVAIKFSLADSLPRLPYLTFLDRWLLSLFLMLIAIAAECSLVYALQARPWVRRLDYACAASFAVFCVASSALAARHKEQWALVSLVAAAAGAATWAMAPERDAALALWRVVAATGASLETMS